MLFVFDFWFCHNGWIGNCRWHCGVRCTTSKIRWTPISFSGWDAAKWAAVRWRRLSGQSFLFPLSLLNDPVADWTGTQWRWSCGGLPKGPPHASTSSKTSSILSNKPLQRYTFDIWHIPNEDDQVAPGIGLERHFLSPKHLSVSHLWFYSRVNGESFQEHNSSPASFPPEAMMAMQQAESLKVKGTHDEEELFTDVVCFGSRDVARLLTLGMFKYFFFCIVLLDTICLEKCTFTHFGRIIS